jgi:predicted nucleic acid-binding protein
MKPDSTNSKLFSMMKAEFCAPEFIKQEFDKYVKECLEKSKLSESEFKLRKKEIFEKINFIGFKYYKELIEKAKKINAPIWSNDYPLLKNQNKVKVLSTEDIIDILF